MSIGAAASPGPPTRPRPQTNGPRHSSRSATPSPPVTASSRDRERDRPRRRSGPDGRGVRQPTSGDDVDRPAVPRGARLPILSPAVVDYGAPGRIGQHEPYQPLVSARAARFQTCSTAEDSGASRSRIGNAKAADLQLICRQRRSINKLSQLYVIEPPRAPASPWPRRLPAD